MKHVPTCAELVQMRLAHTRIIPKLGTFYVISDEGHALMNEAMRHNAAEARAAGSADWVQPPSRSIPALNALKANE